MDRMTGLGLIFAVTAGTCGISRVLINPAENNRNQPSGDATMLVVPMPTNTSMIELTTTPGVTFSPTPDLLRIADQVSTAVAVKTLGPEGTSSRRVYRTRTRVSKRFEFKIPL